MVKFSPNEQPMVSHSRCLRDERNNVTSEVPIEIELNDIINYLVDRKFRANKDEDFPSISRWRTMPASLDLECDYQEKHAYKVQLTNKSSETLARLLADVKATEEAERK